MLLGPSRDASCLTPWHRSLAIARQRTRESVFFGGLVVVAGNHEGSIAGSRASGSSRLEAKSTRPNRFRRCGSKEQIAQDYPLPLN